VGDWRAEARSTRAGRRDYHSASRRDRLPGDSSPRTARRCRRPPARPASRSVRRRGVTRRPASYSAGNAPSTWLSEAVKVGGPASGSAPRMPPAPLRSPRHQLPLLPLLRPRPLSAFRSRCRISRPHRSLDHRRSRGSNVTSGRANREYRTGGRGGQSKRVASIDLAARCRRRGSHVSSRATEPPMRAR
jgi:hypothetical protein